MLKIIPPAKPTDPNEIIVMTVSELETLKSISYRQGYLYAWQEMDAKLKPLLDAIYNLEIALQVCFQQSENTPSPMALQAIFRSSGTYEKISGYWVKMYDYAKKDYPLALWAFEEKLKYIDIVKSSIQIIETSTDTDSDLENMAMAINTLRMCRPLGLIGLHEKVKRAVAGTKTQRGRSAHKGNKSSYISNFALQHEKTPKADIGNRLLEYLRDKSQHQQLEELESEIYVDLIEKLGNRDDMRRYITDNTN